MATHLVKRGLDLPIAGTPEPVVENARPVSRVAWVAEDYLGLKPSVLVNEGDTVTLAVNGIEYIGAVDADGRWMIPVVGSDLAAAGSLSVSVTTTDAAGNSTTAAAVHGYSVDTVAPELTVSVNPVTADNTINAAEA
ncbi:MAG TPA: hypothetical protein PKX28_02805, partial [Candidatus Hydrogenedentes bacterium]|nr:hypothetical protein [Candidatus Hydrogenedentota bacterium]